MNTIGTKIRKVRELKGFTQEYVAQKLSISQKAYSKVERGETKPDAERVVEIAKILGVDPLELRSFDESFIFSNCTQSGKFERFINQLPEKLIEQYEARIKGLEEEVTYLRELVKK